MSAATTTEFPLVASSPIADESPARLALRRLLQHRSAQVGFVMLLLLILTALFADRIAPFDPLLPLENVVRRSTPCIHLLGCAADQPQHLMGIDGNNRDLFSRVVYGCAAQQVDAGRAAPHNILQREQRVEGCTGRVSGRLAG